MKHLKKVIFLVLLIALISSNVSATEIDLTNFENDNLCDGTDECFAEQGANFNQTPTDIIVFYGEECPHCHELFDELNDLESKGYLFNLIKYEVWHNETNQKLAEEYAKNKGMVFQGVPTFFIGNNSFVGYNSDMKADIADSLNKIDKKDSLIEKYHLDEKSLPILAIFLGFIDGFNPCAFFVLCFLLSMLVYAKSRKRMLLIGGIFVIVSGLIYFVFMSAWLNFFLVAKSITYITLVAGIVALIIGLINVKDFFIFKKGVSLSISNKNKSKLMKKMRKLLKAESLPTMIAGTILLAISANLYELLCTAGFPMVFTKILTENNLSTFSYYSYLALYNIIYVIPLLVIVLIFTFTFNAKKLSESQGEALKLLSGIMMIALGGLLVFEPGLLSNIFAATGTILGAIILTAIILFLKKEYQAYLLEEEEKKLKEKSKKKKRRN